MSDLKIGLGDNLLSSMTDKIRMAQLEQKAPDLKGLSEDPARAEEAATQFEAVLVQQMLKSMWKAVPKNGLLSGSSEEQLYQEMLQEQVAKHISESQSLGIKDMVMEELKKRGA
ncbi:MAG: rod-binding protein [Bdellovibrionales bacterium]|nr:rod-binding protein [Bdellovibrionales bacterium]